MLNDNPIPFVFVPLSRGKVAVIDAADAERVLEHKWCCMVTRQGIAYAQTTFRKKHREEQKRSTILLHRFIMEPPSGMQVDHTNGDTLDCRRQNMRVATASQNCQNRGPRKKGSAAPYKGVYLLKGRWAARITAKGVKTFLGYFDGPENAALAYDRAAIEMHGDFARLNFPEAH